MFKFYLLIAFLCTIFQDTTQSKDEFPYVTIADGSIRGEYRLSRSNKKYAAFEGIPYAQPPIEDLRFEEPVPNKPWRGTLISHKPSLCLQYPHRHNLSQPEILGEEDCLYLSVYTPTLDKDANLNVIVNIHGGIFMFGSMFLAGPSFTMDSQQFVYVNIHYRVGILGFLSTEDDVVPGNNGLKDQVMALRWVQNNIHHFGGNPEAVTIVGCSAGGVSVHFHVLSPLSDGLFKNAVSLSGSALVPWGIHEGNLMQAKKLAASVGCDIENNRNMVKCMKSRTATQLVRQIPLFLEYLYFPGAPFGPVAEKHGSNPFLSKHPRTLLKEGKVKDIPWLVSILEHEGLYPAAEFVTSDEIFEYIETHWETAAINLLCLNFTVPDEQKKNITDKIREFYFHGKPFSREIFSDIVDFLSDGFYLAPIVEAIQLQSKVNRSPVYLYQFNFRGKHSLSDIVSRSNENFGASHGDDQFYIFEPPFEMEEDDMIELMTKMFASFAKTGKPMVPGIEWEPACSDQSDEVSFLNINSATNYTMKKNSSLGNLEFWRPILFNDE